LFAVARVVVKSKTAAADVPIWKSDSSGPVWPEASWLY
jgi:hypothetical protein